MVFLKTIYLLLDLQNFNNIQNNHHFKIIHFLKELIFHFLSYIKMQSSLILNKYLILILSFF